MLKQPTKQLKIYVPADMPGRTVIERTRATVAAGYAEARSGPEASPSERDRKRAAAFRIVVALDRYAGLKHIESEVTIEGPVREIDAYATILEKLE